MALPTEGLAIFDIPHPTDPQVNGIGFYRSVDTGSTLLLDQRIAIPTDNQYGLTHDWEIFVVGALTGVSNMQLHCALNGGEYVLTSETSMVRTTQIWEPGTVSELTAAGAYAPPDRDRFFQNSEDSDGYHGTYRWEIADAWVETQTFTWLFLSDLADASLGAAATTDNDLPPATNIAAVFDEHVFLAGNSTNPHRLFWSKRYRPEAFPSTNFVDIGESTDPVMALTPMVGALGVLCRRTKYYVNGDATSGFVGTESSDRRGTPANNAWAVTPYGVAFLARDGIFLTTFVGKDTELSEKIYPLFIGETVNSEDYINWTDINTSSMAYYKGKLYFFYPSGTNTTPNRVLVYSFTTNEWVMYDHAMRSSFVEEDTDLLTGGGVDGTVYSLESGSSDNNSSIALDAETKDFTHGQPTLRKLFLYAKVDADTASADLTVRVYIDGTLQHTATVNSSRGKALIPLPDDAWGYSIRLRFTYTGTAAIKIYGCSYEYIPLASS